MIFINVMCMAQMAFIVRIQYFPMSCTFDGVNHGVMWMGICMEMIC